MFHNGLRVGVLLLVGCCAVFLFAGQSVTTTSSGLVPPLVTFSGVLSDLNGKSLTGTVGVTFSLYKESEGGAPLWLETQNVQADKTGHYSVMLGSTTRQGLPSELFTTSDARWLGVQVQGQAEQPRVLLVSVPYALKAVDAQTIGGLPPTAFVLATPPSSPSGSEQSDAVASLGASSSPKLSGSGSGTTNYLPLWLDNNGTLGNSGLFQTGTGTKIKLGINTIKPAAALDVKGGGIIRGLFSLPAAGTATASTGFNSQPSSLAASAFNSGTSTAVTQTFQWQAEPVGNDTSSATGSLNLLFGQGTGKPAETGLNIASNGLLTFAAGQTFPGTGNGTITGVTAGTDLTGGGGSGNVTLNLDTTKVPQLATSNTFVGNQTITGALTASGTATAATVNATTAFDIGGTAFAFGSTSTGNTSLGFAGNFTATGIGNTAVGQIALASNTSGDANTGVGVAALTSDNSGGGNTAVGWAALRTNTTGDDNTAVGAQALYTSSTGNFNTAVGAVALESDTIGVQNTATGAYALESNTTGGQNAATGADALLSNTTGSINTAIGQSSLFSNTTGTGNTAGGADALAYNTTGFYNTAFGSNAGSTTNGASTTGSSNTFLGANTNPGTQTALTNASAIGASSQVTESNALVLGSIAGVNGAGTSTLVGIGTTAPTQSLEVDLGNALVRGPASFQHSGDIATFYLGDTNNFVQALFGVGLNFGVFEQPNALLIANGGAVGIGTSSPDSLLTVNGTADKPGGGSWGTFSDARLKNLYGDYNPGLNAVMKLHPIRYRYKDDNGMGIRDRDEHVGFVAQDVQKIIPEAVTENNRGFLLVNNDPILWTMLNAIKEQQREIEALRGQLKQRPASSMKAASTQIIPNKTKIQEVYTVRQQLEQLKKKDARLEARLAHLEHEIESLTANGNGVISTSASLNAGH